MIRINQCISVMTINTNGFGSPIFLINGILVLILSQGALEGTAPEFCCDLRTKLLWDA